MLLPSTPYVPNWHIDLLCGILEALARDRFAQHGLKNRLLANIIPGGMKSLMVNVFLPAFVWGPLGQQHQQFLAT